MGQATLGALYFWITVIGIMLTVYFPIKVAFTLWDRPVNFNIGIVVLLAPFVVSIIEYFFLQRQTEADIQYRYERTPDDQIIVFVAQAIILVLLFTPLLLKVFSGQE